MPPSMDALAWDASPTWDALRWLLDLALQATLLLLAAGVAALLLRRASAATRYLVWMLAFGGLLTLPLLSVFMPRQLALLKPLPTPPLAFQAQRRPEPATGSGQKAPGGVPLPRPQVTQRAPSGLGAATPSPQSSQGPAWAVGALGLWLCGMLAVASRAVAGLRGIRCLWRHSLPLAEGQLLEQARQAQQALRCRRTVALRVADTDADIVVPVTWGWRRPVLLLPSGAHEWPLMRQRAVMLHELGHVVRNDWAVLVVAQAACALFWFHPLVWRAARSLRAESEQATDDQVLAAGMRASDYGECLLEFVRLLKAAQRKPTMNLTVAMAQISTLEKRLLALLDARRKRHGVSRSQVLGGVAVASVALLSVATMGAVGGDRSGLAAASETAAEGRYGGSVTLNAQRGVRVTVGIQAVPAGRDGKASGRSTAALYFSLPYGGLGTPTPPPNRADAPLAKALFALPQGQLLPRLPPFKVNQRTGAFSVSRQYPGPGEGYPNLGRVTLSGILPRPGRAGTFALSLGGRVFRGELSSPGPTPPPTPMRPPQPTATATATATATVDPRATATPVPTPGGLVIPEASAADPGATPTPTAVAPIPPPPAGEPGTVFLSEIRDARVDATPLTARGTTGNIYRHDGYSDVRMGITQGRADGTVRVLSVSLYVPDLPQAGQTFPVTTEAYTVGAVVYYSEARGSTQRLYLASSGTVTIVVAKGSSLQIRLNNVRLGLSEGTEIVGGVGRDFTLNGTLQVKTLARVNRG